MDYAWNIFMQISFAEFVKLCLGLYLRGDLATVSLPLGQVEVYYWKWLEKHFSLEYFFIYSSILYNINALGIYKFMNLFVKNVFRGLKGVCIIDTQTL